SWGIMVPRGDGLVVKRDAPQLSPLPLDKSFIAAWAKRLHQNQAPEHVIARAVKDAKDAEYMRAKEEFARQYEINEKHAQEQYVELLERVRKFEAASGVRISGWQNPELIGDAVRSVLEGRKWV